MKERILVYQSGESLTDAQIFPSFFEFEAHINRRMLFSEFIILALNAIGIWIGISIDIMYFAIIRLMKNFKLKKF